MQSTVKDAFAQRRVSLPPAAEVPPLQKCLTLFTLYFGAAFAAVGLTGQAGNIAFIWPSGPILVVFLLKSRPNHWLGLVAIAALADLGSVDKGDSQQG